jgi:hypothetical protein
MNEELKECPFCGSAAEYSKSDYGEWCNCSKPRERESYCAMQTHYMLKEQWQSRPIEDALRKQLEVAMEAMSYAVNDRRVNKYAKLTATILYDALAEIAKIGAEK